MHSSDEVLRVRMFGQNEEYLYTDKIWDASRSVWPAAMHPPMMVPQFAMNHSGCIALHRDLFNQLGKHTSMRKSIQMKATYRGSPIVENSFLTVLNREGSLTFLHS